jgi:hypothetical protein
MGTIQFDIRHPNGHRESAVIEGQRALIGSGSHCDVRLPIDQAAYEHVKVEVIGGTLRAEAQVESPPATINGMPLSSSPLGADSVLGLGRIRLFVNFIPDVTEGAEYAVSGKGKESNPAVNLGLIAIFSIAAYLLLLKPEVKITPPPAQAPELFSALDVKCQQSNPIQAVALGQEKLDHADGKRERMPFRASDGVDAVSLYRTAAACFRAGGVESQAKDAEDAALGLKTTLMNDFRARRLRLTYTLKVKDFELAKQDVAVLRALTEGKRGPYVEWLAKAEKQLTTTKKGK